MPSPQRQMGATQMLALKLCGGRGVYERLELTEFHDPRPRHRLPSTAVSAKNGREPKRSFKLDAAISLHRAHARCERCHSASRAIRAICGRPTPVVAPCAARGDRFATVSRDDCGRPKFEFSQRQPLHKAPQGDPTGKRTLQAHGWDVGDGERCQIYPQEMPRRCLTKLH